MNREDIQKAINSVPDSSLTDVIGPKWESEIIDRILAALAREREGEVLVVSYEQFHDIPRDKDGCLKGQLIFRPAKGGD